ncbi:DUF916 domain-containing protein [Apilactobacillus micheneri]|uniref:DUF916 domain-containing protein n=1 Tax=Apilactobacillus micheneri TaxID=1899430 RepID=A0A9Q8MTG9_9LACO|nr:DUF916 domain-containing protein [Apilactobacillus micheneri]TPR26292.1 DUF916 domain-containing protein [Apilactobacillus micheneri]TPR27046.1 DUF916 domain-containing protein [Apilactobacillus micheneri]TPR27904.1 DUF916 domain-containing protein [Apilactobacillus micheneri]TPR31809.1 DUF916 domain-containing protein [Apilactobacillus micheneri]TPR32213.1 DUF916 domain-containing protein [Apilactobacillus micheneri]
MLICLLFFFSIFSINVHAAGFSFSASPVQPENENSSYFNLKSQPDQTHQLKVKLTNSGDSKMTVHAKANTALTNDGMDVNYASNDVTKFDSSMRYPLSKLTTDGDKHDISVPAKSDVTTTFNIKAPASDFNGTVLGSLTFTSDPESSGNKGNVKINNAYSYVIPVVIHQGSKAKPRLNAIKADGKVINGINTFYMHFQNNQPVLMTGVEADNAVYTADGYSNRDKPLYSNKKKNGSIAPNTSFNMLLPTNKSFKSGDYVFVSKVYWGDHFWKYVKHFHMSISKAYEDNKNATNANNNDIWMWIMGIIIAILVLIIVVISIIYFHNKKRK